MSVTVLRHDFGNEGAMAGRAAFGSLFGAISLLVALATTFETCDDLPAWSGRVLASRKLFGHDYNQLDTQRQYFKDVTVAGIQT